VRLARRPVLYAIAALVLVGSAAISFRSFSGEDASATALPDACQNLAVVTADPNALADEVFSLQSRELEYTARLQDACDAGA
jgi:hypothetical protein